MVVVRQAGARQGAYFDPLIAHGLPSALSSPAAQMSCGDQYSMMTRPYSLRTALLVFILLPLLVVSTLAGLYSLNMLEHKTKHKMQKDIELIARAIRIPVQHAMQHGHEKMVARAIHSADQIRGVYGVYVYNAKGREISASGPHSPTDKRKLRHVVSQGHRQGKFEHVNGKAVFSYFLPLTDSGGRIDGLLEVTRQDSDFKAELRPLQYGALGVLFVTGVLLSTVILYGHQHAIGNHVNAILQGLARIGAGDREHRVASQGPRELRDVAAGINDMLDSLARQEATLLEQQKVQAQLAQRLRQSEKMAAVGRLAAGIAHELGSPLNVIDGKALRAMRITPHEARGTLGDIRQEVKRMDAIVRQLMDFGRSNPLHCQPEGADNLVRRALARIGGDPWRRGIKCDVVRASPPPTLVVDQLRLEQALTNLLHNAVSAARHQVLIGWYEDASTHVLYIEDDGKGVDESLRTQIFEPFFTTKAVNEGTGLGLAVAHAAVEDHGGYIEVDSSPSLGGARFRIYLPLTVETS